MFLILWLSAQIITPLWCFLAGFCAFLVYLHYVFVTTAMFRIWTFSEQKICKFIYLYQTPTEYWHICKWCFITCENLQICSVFLFSINKTKNGRKNIWKSYTLTVILLTLIFMCAQMISARLKTAFRHNWSSLFRLEVWTFTGLLQHLDCLSFILFSMTAKPGTPL